jgi:hypothetical protein
MSPSVGYIYIDSKGVCLPCIPRARGAIRGFETSVIRARFVGYIGGDVQLHIVGQIGGGVGNYVTFGSILADPVSRSSGVDAKVGCACL